MSKNVRKDLKTIKSELDLDQVERELSTAKISEDNEGLDPESLRKFQPVGHRFKKRSDRGRSND